MNIRIPGENCTTSRCLSHSKYVKSEDIEMLDGVGLEISYLSGKVSGWMGNETVVMGEMRVQRQTIGIAEEVNIPLLDDVEWDGIVGLSYANNKIKNQHVQPLFDNIMAQHLLKDNVFGYVLHDDMASISFGQPDPSKFTGPFFFSKVTEHKYWTITLLDVKKVPLASF